jgi:site-specific recombinase XerD
VLAFVTAQYTGGPARRLQPAGDGAGVSARTVRRRLSSVSGLFAFLHARGDVAANPVPRRLPTRRERQRPRVRVCRWFARRGRCPASWNPARSTCCWQRCGLIGTGRWLRRCEVLGLRLADLQVAARRVFIAEGKGGHQRQIPVSGRFFASVAAYLDAERPPGAQNDRLFVVGKGPRRGQPLSPAGLDQIIDSARARAGLAQVTCHQLRHTCLTRLREAGMALEAVQAQAGHASIESTRIYLNLADDWLASQYRRAAEAIDAQLLPGKPLPAGDTAASFVDGNRQ